MKYTTLELKSQKCNTLSQYLQSLSALDVLTFIGYVYFS